MTEKLIVPKVVSSNEQGDKRRIAIIDSDFIPYYVCHNKKNEEGIVVEKSFEDCKKLADDFVKNILKDTKASHFLMCFTVGKCFRYKVYPYYKAQRRYDIIPFINETKKYLIDTYQGIFDRDYLEADDIVAILKRYYGSEAFIVSPDKDILNLTGQHYNPKNGQWVATLDGNKFFWHSMVTGDAADNIKGIPNKGEKAAEKILGPFTENLREIVLEEYCKHFGEHEGIEQFYLNYKCLKIVDQDDTFLVDKIIPIEVKSKEEGKLNEIG